jgi:2'-deoxynucleoside 5'-phosphate N-hydrolase
MKIYFSGSIRGGRQDAKLYRQLIDELNTYGTVLTEHIGAETIGQSKSDRDIHDEDLAWLQDADIVIAEVTTPSLGVGYEIGRAVEMGKKVVCLYRSINDNPVSAMIRGCDELKCLEYSDLADVSQHFARLLGGDEQV